MASRRNAIQKIRADAKKRVANKSIRSELKTLMRRFLQLVADKKNKEAQDLGQTLFSKVDKAAKKGVLHNNTARRRKSRVSFALNALK